MMRVLTFLGIILLGLGLLATHLCTTFMMGTGMALAEATLKKEAEEVFDELGEAVKEELNEIDSVISPRKEPGQDAKGREEAVSPNESSKNATKDEDIERIREQVEESIDQIRTKPIVLEQEFTLEPVTLTRSYEFPGWVVLYGIAGSFFIVCGTTFLAIAALKHKARTS